MNENIKPGDLFFLTQEYENYVFKRNPKLAISLVNRLAKLEEIIDWSSLKGKRILAARKKSGKWDNLPVKDNKYIFSVYYHELVGRENKQGVVERGSPMFSKNPETGEPFFLKVPDWIYKEIKRKCETFDVQDK